MNFDGMKPRDAAEVIASDWDDELCSTWAQEELKRQITTAIQHFSNEQLERGRKRLTFAQLQHEQRIWMEKNFGPNAPGSSNDQFLGVVEEVGELAHALLKSKQGIRGTGEEHRAAAKDAVADTIIFLCGFCNREGWDLDEIVGTAWDEVKCRDWTKKGVE